VNGAPAPATLYEYTYGAHSFRMLADDGVLAIRWLDGRYELMVFGPVFVDGVESGYHSHTSTGEVAWDTGEQVFRFTPDGFENPFAGKYVGDDMEITYQPDARGLPAKLVFKR
jgi:hypothetical protein